MKLLIRQEEAHRTGIILYGGQTVEERIWERKNGFLSLSIEAGRALHPETQKWVNLPLPFGPKARLIQIHLDTQAKLHDKPRSS